MGEALPTATGQWPWATFTVNAAIARVLGWLTPRLTERVAPTRYWRFLLGTGLRGALTTFSTFHIETIRLAKDGYPGTAVGYAAASLAQANVQRRPRVHRVRRREDRHRDRRPRPRGGARVAAANAPRRRPRTACGRRARPSRLRSGPLRIARVGRVARRQHCHELLVGRMPEDVAHGVRIMTSVRAGPDPLVGGREHHVLRGADTAGGPDARRDRGAGRYDPPAGWWRIVVRSAERTITVSAPEWPDSGDYTLEITRVEPGRLNFARITTCPLPEEPTGASSVEFSLSRSILTLRNAQAVADPTGRC